MYILKYKTNFAAAHQLIHAYNSKCNASLHGHDWKVLVEIKTEELVNNMVIDFKKIKEIIQELDHKNLNEILDFETTAELISQYLFRMIKEHLGAKGKFEILLTVWENENASITYTE